MKKTIIALVLLASFSLASCEPFYSQGIINSPKSSSWELRDACRLVYWNSEMRYVPAQCFKYVTE